MRQRRKILLSILMGALLLAGLALVQKRSLDASSAPLCPEEEENFTPTSVSKAVGHFAGVDPLDPFGLLLRWLPGLAPAQEALAEPLPTQLASRAEFSPADTNGARFVRLDPTPAPVELPEILIYHTHTHEAYNPLGGTAYTEKTGKWRTTDEEYNIVKVGATLAELLRQQGFTVYHDRSDYEMPTLSGAYDRSLAGVEAFIAQHPEITVFIDVHRDAYTQGRVVSAQVEGQDCAQIMFVVGSGESTGFSDLPDLESNKSLAQRTMDTLKSFSPDLVRRMSNKTGRYNQHLSSSCMLIEVGHNMNTLEEALASLPYLARALRTTLADA